MDALEELVALATVHPTLIIANNASRVMAAPRLSRDGIPFEGHDLTRVQGIRQAGFAFLERCFRLLALRDVDVGTDETRRCSIAVGYEAA